MSKDGAWTITGIDPQCQELQYLSNFSAALNIND